MDEALQERAEVLKESVLVTMRTEGKITGLAYWSYVHHPERVFWHPEGEAPKAPRQREKRA